MQYDPEDEPSEVLEKFFEEHEDEFLKYERITTPRKTQRNDLELFLRLDELFPDKQDILSHASHDEVSLSVSPEELTKKATEEQIIDMIRLGLRIGEYDNLAIFV